MRLLFFISSLPFVLGAGEDDLVKNLPGLTFQTNFKTYSGYLNAGNNGSWRMHYVLVESQNNATTDPLLLWFNGGPGCSSFGGLFEELGPFYINLDGQTLFENPYAWNKKANVLALESPIGVGFSYDNTVVNFTSANDDQSRDQNYAALVDFFTNVQPRYKNHPFFLSGESYAGVYIPMLSAKIVEGINNNTFPNANFQGAAIGNGFMHVQKLMNSLVIWSAYHGRISPAKWKDIKANCSTSGASHSDDYNYQQFMTSNNGMDYSGDTSYCGQLISPLITNYPAGNDTDFDQYNYYQDCYVMTQSASGMKRRSNAAFGSYTQLGQPNTAVLTNYDSTDNQWGYPCWNDVATKAYLNRKDVQDALHIEAGWSKAANNTWNDCNDPIYNLYNITYADQTTFFQYVIDKVKVPNFRFLIYNGDVDTVCNYLGDSWFIESLAQAYSVTGGDRNPWLFAEQMAGFVQNYKFKSLSIDVLTVKGAGHFVPNDRPGPSLQMITNFMFGPTNYSSSSQINPQPKLSPLINSNGQGTTQAPPQPTSPKGSSLLLTLPVSILAIVKSFM